MKKILSAWIEQILQFDSESEYRAYVRDLEQKKQKFSVVEQEQDSSGKVTLHIKKQYNNNIFPKQLKGDDINEIQRKVETGYAAVRNQSGTGCWIDREK